MTVGYILSLLIQLYIYVLIGRVIIDMVASFARDWHPTGVWAVVVDLVFRLTDPPLRTIRRAVPMLRLGSVGIDLSFLVLIFALNLLQFAVVRFF